MDMQEELNESNIKIASIQSMQLLIDDKDQQLKEKNNEITYQKNEVAKRDLELNKYHKTFLGLYKKSIKSYNYHFPLVTNKPVNRGSQGHSKQSLWRATLDCLYLLVNLLVKGKWLIVAFLPLCYNLQRCRSQSGNRRGVSMCQKSYLFLCPYWQV